MEIKVYVDSKVIIDWINEKTISLNSWFDKIKELVYTFSRISFEHIYRDHNVQADFIKESS